MHSRGLLVHVALGAAAALGLSVVATSGVGSSPVATPFAGPEASRPDVVVVGESLVHQVAPMEDGLLREAGHRPVIESRDSEDLASSFVQTEVRDAVMAGTPIVVLETAANDAFQGAGTAPPSEWAPAMARYRQTLSSTLAALSHQCTVLVDTRVTDTSKWYQLGRIGPGVDRAIDDAARLHPGTVEAVRWSEESAPHGSDWFWADGLHFGDPAHANADWHDAGATAFARAIASGVERCSADLRGGSTSNR